MRQLQQRLHDHGVVRPDDRRLETEPPDGTPQPAQEKALVQPANESAAMSRHDHGGIHPQSLADAARTSKPSQQPPRHASAVPPCRAGTPQSQRLDKEHAEPAQGQSSGDVLLIGPERTIPIRRGNDQNPLRKVQIAFSRMCAIRRAASPLP